MGSDNKNEAYLSGNGFRTTRAISARMQKTRSKGTKQEVRLQKALWARGHRYRKHLQGVPGKPEIAFVKKKLAVFVDGSFWHGYDWEEKKKRIASNQDYWIPKIERNMARDELQNRQLKERGWAVLRFWDHEVKEDVEKCVQEIERALKKAF